MTAQRFGGLHVNSAQWRGLLQLAADGVCAVSQQAEDLQLRITKPLPFAIGDSLTKNIHGAIRGIAKLSSNSLGKVLQHWPGASSKTALGTVDQNEESKLTNNAISILNGVCGDHLVATQNPLAIEMQLCPLAAGLDSTPTKPIALFVHGLCLNENHWQAAVGASSLVTAMQDLGYQPMFLRYNSGKAIVENGADLAKLLAANMVGKRTIVVIAHSMGGLLVRHALQQAHSQKMAWRNQLRQVFYLGTPHAGAPLEQAGHWVHGLWRTIPYAAALAPIASLRSKGITDLRQGLNEVALANVKRSYKEYAIAGILTQSPVAANWKAQLLAAPRRHLEQLLGDGLVPVASALGEQALASARMPASQQQLFVGIGHLALMQAPEVIQYIVRCLSNYETGAQLLKPVS